MSFSEIQNLYITFLNNFPEHLRSIISIACAVLVVYAVFKIVKKDFIFIVVLVILLPGSVPILKSVWQGVVAVVKFLLNTK
jgi:glutamate racemase